ncbi:MAG: hypothetical protein CMJ12_00565 [Pelagibacterales bacterium]|nr:hypothetical protein [Pelagibacterales bacterium]PPR16030.1 MAG: hypothetical protein CFH33_01029 [Alphaproteobacteria bacterium MarineAlpha9_Bin3]|tara:strand:+ start:17556 stop:18029 length:474 start_codon:yes stop_codon:yes gene_type:complete
MAKLIDNNYSQSDMFDEDILADIALRRTIQFRLKFWINICKNPVSHGNYYWNSSPEHRLIAMLAISSYMKQIPINLINENISKDLFTVSMVRLLTHISERKIQRIIKMGVDRGDIELIKDKPPQYQGTKQLLSLYEIFEKSWIDSQKDEIKSLNKKY